MSQPLKPGSRPSNNLKFHFLCWFFFLFAGLTIFPLAEVEAGGFFDTFGADPSGMALGGAMAASAKGWASLYYNPAALALSKNVELSLGFIYAKPQLTIHRSLGIKQDMAQFYREEDSGLDSLAGPAIGIVLPIQRCTPKRLPIPVALGVGFFMPRQTVLTNRVVEAEERFPYDVIFNQRNSSLTCLFGISTRITSAIYFGVGAASQMVSPGMVYLTDLRIRAIETSTRFSAPTLIYGILLRPHERIQAGAVYREENKILSKWEFDLDVRAGLPFGSDEIAFLNFGFLQYNHLRHYVTGYSPENYSFGGAFKLTQRLKVSADAAWYRWSKYDGLFDQPLQLPFKDIWVYRIGIMFRITRKLEARCGYYFEPTPVSQRLPEYLFVGNDRHVFSGGFGYSLKVPWGILAHPLLIETYFQYHLLEEGTYRLFQNNNPYVYPGEYTTSGQAINGGISLTFSF